MERSEPGTTMVMRDSPTRSLGPTARDWRGGKGGGGQEEGAAKDMTRSICEEEEGGKGTLGHAAAERPRYARAPPSGRSTAAAS